MNDRQLRMLRWVSALLGQISNPEVRALLSEAEMDVLLRRGKMVIEAEIALESTGEVEQVGVAKDVEELEKLYSLD